MVTTAEEEPQPVGAIAALGGEVRALVSEGSRRATYGDTRLATPLLLIALTLIPVALQPNPWVVLLGVLTLMALTVWCVVTTVRKEPPNA